jgi:hypothetical protein
VQAKYLFKVGEFEVLSSNFSPPNPVVALSIHGCFSKPAPEVQKFSYKLTMQIREASHEVLYIAELKRKTITSKKHTPVVG